MIFFLHPAVCSSGGGGKSPLVNHPVCIDDACALQQLGTETVGKKCPSGRRPAATGTAGRGQIVEKKRESVLHICDGYNGFCNRGGGGGRKRSFMSGGGGGGGGISFRSLLFAVYSYELTISLMNGMYTLYLYSLYTAQTMHRI